MTMDLDTVLLDRLFQRASDRLAAWTSCFGLARFALAAAALLQFVVLVTDLAAEADFGRRMMATAIALLGLLGASQARHVVARAERQARPGLMNIRRITLRWQRSAWLALSLWSMAAALVNLSPGTLAVAGASLGWLACVYFASCTAQPPARQGSRPWAFSAA